jgi:hypothetical protein
MAFLRRSRSILDDLAQAKDPGSSLRIAFPSVKAFLAECRERREGLPQTTGKQQTVPAGSAFVDYHEEAVLPEAGQAE